MGIFNEGGVMESAVPRPAVVAPVPATMSPEMRMIRQGMAPPTTAPVARTAPTVSVTPKVSTMAPIAAAQAAYQETSNPFDAFLQGWTNAGTVREGQAEEQAKMDQVATALEKHKDLAQFVRSGVMEPADAVRIAGDRDAATSKASADAARKDQIGAYLTELAGSDERYGGIAQQWAAGVLDEDGVAKAIEGLDKPKEAPAGYRYGADGNLEAIPGGPSDPANPLNEKKLAGEGRSLTAAEIKELFDAQDGIAAGEAVTTALDKALKLNETAWDGPLADIGTQAGALVGDANSADTQELKNLVTAQALDQLKATFGAVPTEGERKILLEIQGSVNQSREVRKRIFERAKAAADRRIKENRIKAEGIQTGDYRRAGFDPTGSGEGDPDLSGLSDEELLQQLTQ